MITAPAIDSRESVSVQRPTIWGLSPTLLHDRFWASRGVQVVRIRERSELVDDAELFLLCDPGSLALFQLTDVVDVFNWLQPEVLFLRIRDPREHDYREIADVDEHNGFTGFRRVYGGSEVKHARVALTTSADIARDWQNAENRRDGWRMLRAGVSPEQRATVSVRGRIYDGHDDAEVVLCVERLVDRWARPDTTIGRATRAGRDVWLDVDSDVSPGADFIGPAWVGAGRRLSESDVVVGPAILWDVPGVRPAVVDVAWQEIEPTPPQDRVRRRVRVSTSGLRPAKRAFDVLFALVALLLTLPIYPFVMLAIMLEDGAPSFFGHVRETVGGREFRCWKFRSMRKDAENVKALLQSRNLADGPQFFIEDDPRLTRVGRIIRALQIDELPQFWNVLKGDMSVVGPRPSPHRENQYCPPWREARLSVRPGVTGLWQVMRTREHGRDFQEWIKFDLEYVEKQSWPLDFQIIWKTVILVSSRFWTRG